jgi:hypothetical protein
MFSTGVPFSRSARSFAPMAVVLQSAKRAPSSFSIAAHSSERHANVIAGVQARSVCLALGSFAVVSYALASCANLGMLRQLLSPAEVC